MPGRKTTIRSLAFLVLAAVACRTTMDNPTSPPRISDYFPPCDSLSLVDGAEQLFSISVEGGSALEYHVRINDVEVASTPSYLLSGGIGASGASLHLQIECSSGQGSVRRSWQVGLLPPDLPGWLFVQPDQLSMETPAGQGISFHMDLMEAPADGPILYRWLKNGTLMSSSQDFFFPALSSETCVITARCLSAGLDLRRDWQVTVTPSEYEPFPFGGDSLRCGPGQLPGTAVLAFRETGGRQIAAYEVRGHYQPLPAEIWDSAFFLGVFPSPPETDLKRFTVSGLEPGRRAWFRLRALEQGGHASLWSELTTTRMRGYVVTGEVFDFLDEAGIGSMNVLYGQIAATTDGEGHYHCANVSYLGGGWSSPSGLIGDEDGSGVGAWFDIVDFGAVETDSTHRRLGTFANSPLETVRYPHMLGYLSEMFTLETWDQRLARPMFPIPVHLPDFEQGGMSYGEVALAAMEIWEEDSGLDLFTVAPDSASAVIHFVIEPIHSGFTRILERDALTLAPTRIDIHISDAGSSEYEATMQRVFLHELGHGLGLWAHSKEPAHAMNIVNTSDRPHPDETSLLRLIANMPCGQSLAHLRAD